MRANCLAQSEELPMPAWLPQQEDENGTNGGGLPSCRLSMLGKLRRGGGTLPPSTLFSEELHMPAWLAQQEDENKVGRAILRASLG